MGDVSKGVISDGVGGVMTIAAAECNRGTERWAQQTLCLTPNVVARDKDASNGNAHSPPRGISVTANANCSEPRDVARGRSGPLPSRLVFLQSGALS